MKKMVAHVNQIFLRYFTLTFLAGLASVFSVNAQCSISVKGAAGPLPNASIIVEGKPAGATDLDGLWSRRIVQTASRLQKIEVRALGFEPWEGMLSCAAEEKHSIQLQESTFALGGATVIGSLSAMKLKESPIRTQVLAGRALRDIPADDATEALDFSNGLREPLPVVSAVPTTYTSMDWRACIH